jgi:hypothetical protein
MVLDRAVGRDRERLFGHQQQHVSHDAEFGVQALHLLPNTRVLEGRGLEEGEILGEREFLERIQLRARLVGRAVDADDLLAAIEQRFEHRMAEGLLAVEQDTH